MTKLLNRLLKRLFPKAWDEAVHRVAVKRGLTDADVRRGLR